MRSPRSVNRPERFPKPGVAGSNPAEGANLNPLPSKGFRHCRELVRSPRNTPNHSAALWKQVTWGVGSSRYLVVWEDWHDDATRRYDIHGQCLNADGSRMRTDLFISGPAEPRAAGTNHPAQQGPPSHPRHARPRDNQVSTRATAHPDQEVPCAASPAQSHSL